MAHIYSQKDEGITDFYGELTPQEIIDSLGTPIIDLERYVVAYCEHTLDDLELQTIGIQKKILHAHNYESILISPRLCCSTYNYNFLKRIWNISK